MWKMLIDQEQLSTWLTQKVRGILLIRCTYIEAWGQTKLNVASYCLVTNVWEPPVTSAKSFAPDPALALKQSALGSWKRPLFIFCHQNMKRGRFQEPNAYSCMPINIHQRSAIIANIQQNARRHTSVTCSTTIWAFLKSIVLFILFIFFSNMFSWRLFNNV